MYNNWRWELVDCFKGIHIFDGSDEIKQFLGISGCDLEIESGIPFEAHSQQYETLFMKYYIYMTGTRNITYNFSYQLGLVYSKVWYFMGNHGAGGPEIVLTDFDF